MTCPQEPSPKYSLAFRRLCLAILCERWAAFMLISTVALMLGHRFGFSRPSALRLWGLVSAASYVGALPGGYLLDRTRLPSRGIGLAALLLLLGYVALSVPLRAALYVALTLLIIGHALFKPSTQRFVPPTRRPSA